MAFRPINYATGKLVQVKAKASITFVKGNALKDDGAGYITNAAAGDNTDVRYVAMENKVTGSSDGELLLVIETGGVRFEADTDANPAQTDVGTEADLAGAGTVDPDASTDDVFFIEGIVGAVADRKVVGYFTRGVPNS
jgi:hypothetical protein